MSVSVKARGEADKRLYAFLGPVLFIAALWRVQRQYGTEPGAGG